jgi:putative aldouronate transport system substrate-binding protein
MVSKSIKPIGLFVVVTFILLTLVCCRTNKGIDSSKDTLTKPRNTQIKDESDIDLSVHVKITGYLIGSPLPGTPDVMAKLNDWLKRDLNAELEIKYISWGNFQSKYPLILAADEDADWIFTAQWAFYPQLAAKGAFMEITTEMLEKYMPRHYLLLKNTPALNEAKINGRVYMVPTSTPDRKSSVFIYREDLRKKYQVPEINSFSDLEPYMQAVRQNEPGMIPLNVGSNYDFQTPFLNLVAEQYDYTEDIFPNSAGGSGIVYFPLDNDGKLYYITEEPIVSLYKKTALKMKAWYDNGFINKNAYANKIRSKEAFVQGKSAVGLGNTIDIQGNISQATAEGYEVGLVPILSGKSGKIIADPYTSNGFALSRNAKNPERTLMVMDLIMEDRDYNMLVYYGIEGVHYSIENEKIRFLNNSVKDKIAYPPDQSGFWFTNKEQFPPHESWSPPFIELQEKIKKVLAPNIYSSFMPSTDNIKTETENCNQVIIQYFSPIQIGAFDNLDEAFEILEDKLRSSGVERIMAEMQKQTADFLLNK